MKVKIKLISGSYFFVGSVALKCGEEVEIDVDLLSNTEKVMLLRYDTPPSYFETSHNLFEVLKVRELCDLPPLIEQTLSPYAILISDDGVTISGYTEPKAEVTILNLSEDKVVAKELANDEGFFNAKLLEAVEDGALLSISAILPPKTKSEEVVTKADLPIVDPYDLAVVGLSNLTGRAQVGYTIQTEKEDEAVPDVVTDSEGKFKTLFSKPLFSDMSVSVRSTKGDKTSAKVSVAGIKTRPVPPTNVVITKDSISGTNGKEDDVLIKFKDGKSLIATKVQGSDTSFKLMLKEPVYAPDSVELKGQKEVDGTIYASKPVTIVSTVKGEVLPPSNLAWVSDLRLEGKTDVGTLVEGLTSVGTTVSSSKSEDGKFFLELTKPLKTEETITLKAKRGEVESDSVIFNGEYLVEDLEGVVISVDGTVVSGNAQTGYKVNIKVNNKAAVEVDTVEGVFSYSFPAPLEDKDKVQVRAIDKYNNKSEYKTYNFVKENPNESIELKGFVSFSKEGVENELAKNANPGDTLYLHLTTKNLVIDQEIDLEVMFKDESGSGAFETPKVVITEDGVTVHPLVFTSTSVDTEMHTEVKIKGVTNSKSQEVKVYSKAVVPTYTPSQGPSKIPVETPFELNFQLGVENYDVRSLEWKSTPLGVKFTEANIAGLSVTAEVPANTKIGTSFDIAAVIDGKTVQHSTVVVFDAAIPPNLTDVVISESGDSLTASMVEGASAVFVVNDVTPYSYTLQEDGTILVVFDPALTEGDKVSYHTHVEGTEFKSEINHITHTLPYN